MRAMILTLILSALALGGDATINGGTLDIPQGTVLTVTAAPAPLGKVFDRWTGDTAGLTDPFASTTTLVMPDSPVSLTATYKDDPANPPPPADPPDYDVPITALLETAPMHTDADDPAIWLASDLSASRIYGTDKGSSYANGSIFVYNLAGQQLQRIDLAGAPNNCDVLQNLNGSAYLFASDKGERHNGHWSVRVWKIDPATGLLDLTGSGPYGEAAILPVDIYRPIGCSVARHPVTAKTYLFVTGYNDGLLSQFEVSDTLTATLVREADVGKVEGVVMDAETGRLFYAQENDDLMAADADHNAPWAPVVVATRESVSAGTRDLEGLAIYYGPNGTGYVAMSVQGSRFALFDRLPPFAYRGSFDVVRGVVGDCDQTDGIDICSTPLPGTAYPWGFFIAHDSDGKNFKVVPWERIADSALALLKNSIYDPR